MATIAEVGSPLASSDVDRAGLSGETFAHGLECAPGAVLRRLTEYYLSIYLYETARFYAERLYYEEPSERNLNVWAHTYYQQGKMKQTYLMLKDSSSMENRYLLG